MAPAKLPRVRTVQAVADELAVSVSTVRRLVAAGAFPNAFRIADKAIRIPREDLEAYRRAHRVTNT